MIPYQATLLVLAAGSLLSCAPERREYEIGAPRVAELRPPRFGASSAERFGVARQQQAQAPFDFELPEGWTELPPQQFRDVHLRAPGGVAAWVTVLGAAAGSMRDNLVRWRGQLGLPAPSEADLAALEEITLLGEPAHRVDLTSPDGSERLVALTLFEDDRSVFARMSGSAAAVEAQLEAFAGFAASLRDRRPDAGMPDDAVDVRPVAPPREDAAATGAGGFGWTRPAGWTDVGPGPSKLYEFLAGRSRCWLTPLEGDGGGLSANVARWCRQIGHAPLSAAEIAALPTLEVLDQPAQYVTLLGEGRAEGMLGVIAPLAGRTLFVKMQGPSDELRMRRSEFEAFCRSLTVKE